MTSPARNTRHTHADIAAAASLFFAVRGIMRTKFAHGKPLDPSTWLRIETMQFIADHAQPSMRAVATHLSITAPSASSLVAALVRDGLVEQTRDPRDRRTRRLSLTSAGQAKLRRTLARGTRVLAQVFAPLSRAELTAFTKMLRRIRDEAGG